MQTRRKRKADEGGASVEKIDRRTEKVEEKADEGVGMGMGSRRPKRAASKGILSAIEAAQGPRRRAARKKAGATDGDEKAKESGSETQKGAKNQVKGRASKKAEVACDARPRRDVEKKDGREANRETKEGEQGTNKRSKTKALKPEDIVQMLGNDAEEEVEDRALDKSPLQPPSKKVKDIKTSKASAITAGGKRTKKKLKPDDIREMLDGGINISEDGKEDEPARKTETRLIEREVSKRSVESTTGNKMPVYRMGTSKVQDDKKTADIDIYDAFNPIYNEEFGPEDKKMKARRAAKARRLAKKKEEAKIFLTFGAAARENVVPAIKTLKNLKTPTQQNRRPLKAMNQMRSLAPSLVVEKASSQNPPPTTIPNRAEVTGRNTLVVPKAKACKKPTATVALPPADFSDMASFGADAYFPSYVEDETGTSLDAYSNQAEGGGMGKLSTRASPEQHKNYKTPAVPRHIGRRIDGKVSTPREQPVNVEEDKDAKLSTKDLVKKCFGFDSDDTGSEMDNESLTDISPVRGIMGPPQGNMSMSRLSTISIPDKASSTFVAGKSSIQEMCIGPFRANLPTKTVSRHTTAIRSKKPPSKLPCNVPSKMSSTAKLDLPPPPKVINAREKVKAMENTNSKKEQRVNVAESTNPQELGEAAMSTGGSTTEKNDTAKGTISDPTPGCSTWPDNYAAAVDDLNRAPSNSDEEHRASLVVNNDDLGDKGALNVIGETKDTGGDEDDDNEWKDMDEDEDKGEPGKENKVTKAKGLEGAKQRAKKSKKSRNAARQPLISEMLLKETAAVKGKRPAVDESTDDESMAIPHQKRKKAYCKRTLNTSIGSSPVKVNKRKEKRVNEWANLQTSHFSEVDEFDLTFA